MREICQKGEGELFLVSAYVYRPFTIYFSRFCIFLGLRSNLITFLSLLAGLAAAGLALSSTPFSLLAAAFFLQVYSVLDHVDGEVARFDLHSGKQTPSLAGDYFDFWTHFHTLNLVFACLGLGLFLQTGSVVWAILGILACNISGNFPRLVLASVVLSGLARDKIALREKNLEPILDICCGISQGSRFARQLPFTKRAYLVVSEFLGFPGNVMVLTIVFVGDGLISLSHPRFYLLRTVYLSLYCVYGVLSKAARTIVSIRQLKQVPIRK